RPSELDLVGNAVDAADRHRAADVLERQPLGLEVLLVGRQQGREVPARGMAADEKLVRVAAVVADVLVRPGEGAGHVLDLLRVLYPRPQAIVRQHGADAAAGQEPADRGVKADATLVADRPAAAVDEDDDGVVLLAPGKEQVELVANGVSALSLD